MGSFFNQNQATSSLNIPVAVIPLFDCSEGDVETVRDAVRQAVPYLEELTGLRYYPAPTYLINSQQMQILSPDREVPTEVSVDTETVAGLLELIRFVKAIALSFHKSSFLPVGLFIDDKDYAQYTSLDLSEESLCTLISFAKTADEFVVEYLESNEIILDYPEIHIPELSSINDRLFDIEVNLREIAYILMRLAKRYPYQITVMKDYFCNSNHLIKCGGLRPDLGLWDKIIKNPKEMAIVNKAIDDSGSWTLRLDDMAAVFDIVINAIFPLISALMSTKSGLNRLRMMGLYFPPDSVTQNQVCQIIGKSSVSIGQSMTGGKVFIDIECCADIAKGISAVSALAKRMLSSVVLHEHAHGIVREGQPFEDELPFHEWPSIPSETLAEWAELNFYRNDPEMQGIILRHAGSGRLPEWPYAGARIFEAQKVKRHRILYRNILRLLRNDPVKAVKRIF